MAAKIGYLERGGDTLYPKTLGTLVVKADGTTQFCEEGAQVNVIETIKVNGTTQTVTNKAVDLTITSSDVYEIKQVGTPASQYAAQYYLDKNGTQAGSMINIPKDMVVQSGSCVNITFDSTTNKLYDGQTDVTELIKGAGVTPTAADAGAYLKLIIANATNDTIYIAAMSMVTTYTNGDGITITNNAISVNYGNGLEISSGAVKVKAGSGVSVGSSGVAVNTGDGLTINNGAVKANLASSGGLQISSGALAVKINALAPSLALDSNGLKVNLDSVSDLTIGANGLKLSGESSTSKVVYFTEITLS